MKTRLLFIFTFFFTISEINAQVSLPYYEGFDYADNAQLTTGPLAGEGGWLGTYTGDGSDPFVVDAPTWTLPTGLPPQTGRAIEFQGGSEDPVLTFSAQGDTGFVYSSFVFRVVTQEDVTDLNGGFIYSFGKVNSDNDGFNYASAVYTKKIDATTFNIGIAETNSTSKAVFSGTAFSIGTDYFIVISYDIENQISHIWINPTSVSASTEPTPDVSTTTDTDTGSRDDIVVVRLSLESNARTPEVILDEIRIGNTWASIVTNPVLSISDSELQESIKLYPNPAQDFITIESKNSRITSIEIFDLLGKSIYSKMESNSNEIDVSDFSNGIYLLKLESEGKSLTKKIVIN